MKNKLKKSDTKIADTKVDELYRNLRKQHGKSKPGANGYRIKKYFLNEQAMVLSEISNGNNIIVDLACGSGLMIEPLNNSNKSIIGIDFNKIACKDAKDNNITVIRGDVFRVPIADSSIDSVINCQFLNQQPEDKAKYLLDEIYRILRPGGKLILIWRNDRALIHKLAVFIYRYIDMVTGRPEFPYYDNYIEDLAQYCSQIGFSIEKKILTFPLFRWDFHNLKSTQAKIFGASCFLVVLK